MHPLQRARDRLPPTASALVRSAREKEIMLFAGGLAFYGLVSIVPSMILAVWITDAFIDAEGFRRLGQQIEEMTPLGSGASAAIARFESISTGVGVGALISALWPSTAYGSGLVRAFDRITELPERDHQGVRGRLKALLFLVLLPLFLVGALGTSYLTSALIGDGGAGTVAGYAVALLAGFVAAFVVVALVYRVFGPGHLPPRALATGAAAAAFGVAVMSVAFVAYLGRGADFEQQVAGSGLAAAVLLALWLYLANTILLLGFALARSAAGATSDPAEPADEDDRREREDRGQPCGGASAATPPGEPSSSSASTGSRTSSRR